MASPTILNKGYTGYSEILAKCRAALVLITTAPYGWKGWAVKIWSNPSTKAWKAGHCGLSNAYSCVRKGALFYYQYMLPQGYLHSIKLLVGLPSISLLPAWDPKWKPWLIRPVLHTTVFYISNMSPGVILLIWQRKALLLLCHGTLWHARPEGWLWPCTASLSSLLRGFFFVIWMDQVRFFFFFWYLRYDFSVLSWNSLL